MRRDLYPTDQADKRTYTRWARNLLNQVEVDRHHNVADYRLNFRAQFCRVPAHLLPALAHHLNRRRYVILEINALERGGGEVSDLRDYEVLAVRQHPSLSIYSALAVACTYLDQAPQMFTPQIGVSIWESIGHYTDSPEPEWQA